ncbi:MAG: FadR/GntR family transcriptional regulator [Desulfitobacteriaceae bacterium]|nr:FadR/GntR family transcriptional regulator [Desulfitobacteriaceae bacterium]MDI6916048.1 FadR/GntR family transcriptional regulator [Desulfitobacteriaceae bacterium]
MIARRKASEQIVEELMRMIQYGHYVQGDRLPSENELAKMFGVSRSPVREALSVLTASGMIESRQGGGSYVKAAFEGPVLQPLVDKVMDLKDTLYLLEMRQMLEPGAAALAAQRRDELDLENIKETLIRFGDVSGDDKAIGEEEDFAFHRALVVAAHNPILLDIVDYVSKHYHRSLTLTLTQNIGLWRKRQQVYKEHEAIFEAIQEKQSDLAKVQSRVHLEKVWEKITGSLPKSTDNSV